MSHTPQRARSSGVQIPIVGRRHARTVAAGVVVPRGRG